jgi:afadin
MCFFQEPSSPAVHIVDTARDLPATLEFRESGEDAFFAVVVSEVNGSAVNFKLAPTFTLYMCCRYRLSPKFWPEFPPNKRREKVTMTAQKVASMMWQTVKVGL